jgi:hypothetical protein
MEPIQIDGEDLFKNKYETISLNKTNISEFRYLKDTTFRIPKVYIYINIYHPFYRPGNVENRDCFYFEYMLYLTYIQREINITLSDAIRAGNKIIASYDKNCIYIDVIAFSDVAESIIVQIKKIISDNKKFSEIFKDENIEQFNLYMKSALEDNLNVNKTSINKKATYLFYHSLNKDMYKNYEFSKEYNNTKIIHTKCKDIFRDNSNLVVNDYIYCLIYGNYNKTQAQRIVEIFNKTHDDSFNNVLERAGLGNKNIKEGGFKDWMIYQNLSFLNSKVRHDYIKSDDIRFKNHTFIYVYWSPYKIVDKIKISIYKKILGNKIQDEKYSLSFDILSYYNIYLVIHLHNRGNSANKDFEKIKNKINVFIKNKIIDYSERFDVVGSRLYYIIKNIINQQNLKSRDMESKAITLFNSYLYSPILDINEITQEDITNLKKMSYIELIDNFTNNINNNYYVYIDYNETSS